MMCWRKITPNPKRRNCGNSPQILERLAWFWSTFLFRRGPRRNVPSFKTHVLNYLSFPFDCLFCHVPDSQKCSKNPNTFLCRGWSHSALAWTSLEKGRRIEWWKNAPSLMFCVQSFCVWNCTYTHFSLAEAFIIILGLFALFWLAFTCFDLFWPLLIGFRVATICLRMLRRCRHSSTHCGPQWELLVLPVIVLSKKVVIYLFI